ncbi:MAG: OB-fold domain-containing protein [Thermodesulfobacteriota bacterium]|nr:OB-fold domain-containing protein [Thermodesulfobacteriota bacterium]
MVGIVSYGAYLPLYRLNRGLIRPYLRGEKTVANFDEDSITMAATAAMNCLDGADPTAIDGLYFATTTSPYVEKQVATLLSAAAGLRKDIFTADCASSLKAGTGAIKMAADAVKAGSAKQVLVTAADCRLGGPYSDFESNCGDGAGAVIIGDKNVVANIEGSHSIAHEIIDYWRSYGDTYIRAWEDRFVFEQGYLKVMASTIAELMKKNNLAAKDISKFIYNAPDARRHADVARALRIDASQVQNPMFDNIGNTGVAAPLVMLAAALEEAKPGDAIILACYGNGVDTLYLKVTDNIGKLQNGKGVSGYIETKKMIGDYKDYLIWKEILVTEAAARRPPRPTPSPASLFREQSMVVSFHGVKCNNCGYVQTPPQRICTKCHSKDNFDDVGLSNKRGELFTYAMDYIAGTMDVPLVISVVNLEGGGRILCMMTDRDTNELKVGMPVEMTFRKFYTAGGIHNYHWKCMPLRLK